jgi:hypothetical protein
VSVRINNANDRAIRWRIFSLEREAGLFAAAPKNQLANAGTHRIHRHHRLSNRFQIFVEGLNDKQLPTFKRFIFDGGYYGADNASELHKLGADLRAAVSADVTFDHVDEYVQAFLSTHLGLC